MVVEDAAALMDSFRRVVGALTEPPKARKAALAAVVDSLPADNPLKRLIDEQRPRLDTHGLSALLFAATARVSDDVVRQVAERWVVDCEPDSLPPWLRYIEGDALCRKSEPHFRTIANKHQTLRMVRSSDGSFWSWGGKSGRGLRRIAASDGAELAKASANFDLGEGDVGENGWLALGCPHDESVVGVWDDTGKRLYRFDSGRDFSSPRWLPNSPTPTLVVADGDLACLDLGQKKPRERWRYEHADKNALRPIRHVAVSRNGSEIFVLEIDWDNVGAARCLVLSPEDGKVTRTVPLDLRFGNDDSGCTALSPDGQLLAFASDHNPSPCGMGVFALDLETGAIRQHLAPNLSICALHFESRTELWCGSSDGLVIHCDLDGGTLRALRAGGDAVVAIIPIGDDLFVALLDGKLLRFARKDCAFDLEELPQLELARMILAVPSEPRALIFTDKSVRQVWEGDGTTSELLPNAVRPQTSAVIDAHATRIASTERLMNTQFPESVLTVYSLDSKRSAAPYRTQVRGHVERALISPAAVWFPRDSKGEQLISLRYDTGEWTYHVAWGDGSLEGFCWCEATNEIACAVLRVPVGLVLLSEKGELAHELYADQGSAPTAVLCLGPRLLAMFEDGTLRIFTLEDRKLCSELKFDPGPPVWWGRSIWRRCSLSGSAETDRALAASGHGSAILFAPSKSEIIASLSQGKPVVLARTSRDGRLVLTVEEGGLLSVWNASDGKLILNHAFAAQPWGVVWVGSREILVRENGNHMVRVRLEGFVHL